MVALVGLDHVAVERRGLPVPRVLAERDELAVLDDGDRLARELAGGDALHGRREAVEVREERPVTLCERVEGRRSEAERLEPVGDQAIVLGLVTDLPGEGELHLHVVGRDEPARRDLRRLDLVLQRDLEEVHHAEIARDLGPERVVGGEPPEELLVLVVEPADELFGRHAVIPSVRSWGSSCVSVSFVTTRSQRPCQGWVSRASAWVVKARTGTFAASVSPKTRA